MCVCFNLYFGVFTSDKLRMFRGESDVGSFFSEQISGGELLEGL